MPLKQLRSYRKTLAFRLTLWYAGVFAVSSCIAFLLFYTMITSVFRERTDQELLAQAREFSATLSTRGIEAVRSLAMLEAQAAGVKKVFLRLLSSRGEVFSSSNMSYWQDIDIREEAIKQLVRDRKNVFETITIPNRKDKVRVLHVMVGTGVILQIGQSMEADSRFIDAFKNIFFITMVLLVGLSAGVGWFMARRAVSGVAAVTRTAQEISGGTLDKRVPVGTRGDEIDQLAATFNQMLGRIQALITEIKEMSDNIAHDLKSPITRIRGMAEVTLTTGKGIEEYESMAAGTVEECDRLLDMINTMLMITKAESGLHPLDEQKVDMARLVRDACELLETVAEDRGLSLTCEMPETFTVLGDPRMIQRILANLIDNAVKYTPSGGTVKVSLSETGGEEVVVAVQDTGIGIPAGDLPHVFERFYRCDQSRSEPGTGLGLSLARALARAHYGDITVTSTLGQGSTFTLTLPKSRRPYRS
ncbi:MAG: two component system sensor histidine kinase, related to CopS, partial [Deltaproteobacteria bacterium]|nr:two component system sensor histidine kinase, related to CopS [Deltaproteobacteria bacterium]